jgi:hypothetical protein
MLPLCMRAERPPIQSANDAAHGQSSDYSSRCPPSEQSTSGTLSVTTEATGVYLRFDLPLHLLDCLRCVQLLFRGLSGILHDSVVSVCEVAPSSQVLDVI